MRRKERLFAQRLELPQPSRTQHFTSLEENIIQPLGVALNELKEFEITCDQRNRTGDDKLTPTVDECVVKYLKHKPVYQIEKLLISWVERLGFDSLNSNNEIEENIMRDSLYNVIQSMNQKSCDLLDKWESALNKVQVLNPTDPKFMKMALQFINGGLKKYFKISIAKKTKHIKRYVLKNNNISAGLFEIYGDEVQVENAPLLGKDLKKFNDAD